eukprot:COSAG01_NODE_3675_length_5804_cov_4.926919_5_plen_174_part_00
MPEPGGAGRGEARPELIRVRVKIVGSQKCGIVGKSQSALIMIDPIISTRTRSFDGASRDSEAPSEHLAASVGIVLAPVGTEPILPQPMSQQPRTLLLTLGSELRDPLHVEPTQLTLRDQKAGPRPVSVRCSVSWPDQTRHCIYIGTSWPSQNTGRGRRHASAVTGSGSARRCL